MIIVENIDIIKKLDDLLDSFLDNECIIAPIARKGIRVLELSEKSQDLFEKGRILYFDSLKYHLLELRGKRIILFDESARSGVSLLNSKTELITLSKRQSLGLKVETAALLVNTQSQCNTQPQHFLKELECNQDKYDLLSDELMYHILSSGKPLDVDHLILAIRINTKFKNYLSLFNKIATSKELGHSRYFGKVRMITVEMREIFKISRFESFPRLFDEGPIKIRLYLKENVLYIVPIVYPALDISDGYPETKENCRIYSDSNYNTSLCNALDLQFLEDTSLKLNICYNCIINELNCRLIGLFLIKLKPLIDFEILGLEKGNLYAIYHKNEGERLRLYYERKIKSICENYEPTINEKQIASCKIGNELASANIQFFLDSIRPELRVSMLVNDFEHINDALHQGEYTQGTPPTGLSYNQISQIMINRKDLEFSEGMDVALDVGLLKPINITKGLLISSEMREFPAIVRLYSPSSENLRKDLRCLREIVAVEVTNDK